MEHRVRRCEMWGVFSGFMMLCNPSSKTQSTVTTTTQSEWIRVSKYPAQMTPSLCSFSLPHTHTHVLSWSNPSCQRKQPGAHGCSELSSSGGCSLLDALPWCCCAPSCIAISVWSEDYLWVQLVFFHRGSGLGFGQTFPGDAACNSPAMVLTYSCCHVCSLTQSKSLDKALVLFLTINKFQCGMKPD